MSEDIELRLLKEIEELKRKVHLLEADSKNLDELPTYSFSKITRNDLDNLVDIEKDIDKSKFDKWFNNNIKVSKEIEEFFRNLILENESLLYDYNEEDLKASFIIPILNRVKFKSFDNKFRDFYELPIVYRTDKFILKGTTDFVVSKGLTKSIKPYFFIQEFKKGHLNAYPEPQLLAELISAVELNNWSSIRGAYIVGAIWNFVILERLDRHKYIYYISSNFDSTKIEDLKDIYRNLIFVKNEIIELIKSET